MLLYLVEEAVEGLQIPQSIVDRAPLVGPAAGIYQGVKSARRIKRSG